MKKLHLVFLLMGFLIVQSCKNNDYSSEEISNENYTYDEVVNEDVDSYNDNTYCADVEYYNPDTGFRNNYTLNVDVENNEVVKIHFSSGWLDSSEFSSEALDSNGFCSITCYDGRQFDIQITGSECSFPDEDEIQYVMEDESEDLICPDCGNEKPEFERTCQKCTDKRDNICSRCGGFEYYVMGGLCSNCKDFEE